MARVLTTAVLVVLVSCGGVESAPCATTDQCPAGTVCQPSGHCEPFGGRARRAAHWLAVSDWAVTDRRSPTTTRPPTDVLPLGGPAERRAYLSFPIAAQPPVAEAILVVELHPSGSPVVDRELIVHTTTQFDGATLTRASAPPGVGAPVATTTIHPGLRRPIRLDLTAAVRRAIATRQETLSLVLRTDRVGRPLRLASPVAVDRRLRPRLAISRP